MKINITMLMSQIVEVMIPAVDKKGNQIMQELVPADGSEPIEGQVQKQPLILAVQGTIQHWADIDMVESISGKDMIVRKTVVYLRRIDTNELIYVDPMAIKFVDRISEHPWERYEVLLDEISEEVGLSPEQHEWFTSKIENLKRRYT